MNRNVLKIIALISMLCDHVGKILFPGMIVFEILGRLAFPLFAFFISEGYVYTSSKKRYVLTLLIFALISWAPFNLLWGFPWYTFNILGVFLVSILGMFLIDKMKNDVDKSPMYIGLFCLYIIFVIVFDSFSLAPEGMLGVMLPIVFYLTRNLRVGKYIILPIYLIAMSLMVMVLYGVVAGLVQMACVATIPLLAFYNGKKGKLNLKYLFYIAYPLHLLVIWLISLI